MIKKIKARQIIDSRGEPTLESEVFTDRGSFRASVPAGASRGNYEAVEERDERNEFFGKGVREAVESVEKIISPNLKGKDESNQKELDDLLIEIDGSKDKSKLGANTLLSVSMASARAGAFKNDVPLFVHLREMVNTDGDFSLPRPSFNIINGGAHAGNNLDIQEFMIVPNLDSFSKNYQAGVEIYHYLKENLKSKYGSSAINLGDEGGFAPDMDGAFEALDFIYRAIGKAGYEGKIELGIDAAASEFYKEGYEFEGNKLTGDELLSFYKNITNKYPIIFLEDPLSEDDWDMWTKANEELKDITIIGDDLTVTNPHRIKKALSLNACTGMVVKMNQIGTVTETINSALLARKNSWKLLVSHRSGETCDSFVADLAVALKADFMKSGAPARGERTTKYNRLLRIEEEIKSN